MPVILARGIIDINLYNFSGYATKNMHGLTIFSTDLIKRSVLTRKKAYGKCQRFAVDANRYIILGRTT